MDVLTLAAYQAVMQNELQADMLKGLLSVLVVVFDTSEDTVKTWWNVQDYHAPNTSSPKAFSPKAHLCKFQERWYKGQSGCRCSQIGSLWTGERCVRRPRPASSPSSPLGGSATSCARGTSKCCYMCLPWVMLYCTHWFLPLSALLILDWKERSGQWHNACMLWTSMQATCLPGNHTDLLFATH